MFCEGAQLYPCRPKLAGPVPKNARPLKKETLFQNPVRLRRLPNLKSCEAIQESCFALFNHQLMRAVESAG
jgi:hypothetical protein